MNSRRTVTLWRPVGAQELALIKLSGLRAFPLGLPEQPMFCPMLSEADAIKIARERRLGAYGATFVTRFAVLCDALSLYDVKPAGEVAYLEYWIPAEDLHVFNQAIVGKIEIIHAFK